MFGKRKNEEAKVNMEDIFYLVSLIADKLGVALDEEEQPEEEVEETVKEETEETIDNEDVDKREDIDDVGGFLKSKGLSNEDIRHVMKLMEEASYNDSLNGRDNACKNEVEEKEEEKKEIKETGLDNLEKKEELKRPILTAIKKNSVEVKTMNLTRAERIEASNKKYSIR